MTDLYERFTEDYTIADLKEILRHINRLEELRAAPVVLTEDYKYAVKKALRELKD